MLEASLTKSITRALRDEGAYVVKVHGGKYGTRGVPDLLVCYRGHYIGAEVKTPARVNMTTREQRHHLQLIREAGGEARIVTSVAEALILLKIIDERIDP